MNRNTLVVVLLGLAAAASIFYVAGVFAPGEPPTPTGSATAERAGAQGVPEASSDGPMLRGSEVARAVSEEAVDGPEAGNDGTKAWISVRGRLVDSAGAPIGGELLRLTQWRIPSPGGAGEAGAAPRAEATSGEDGAFTFRALANRGGVFSMGGSGGWLLARDAEGFDGSLVDVDLGNILVERAATLAGSVVDRRGAPVGGIVVRTAGGYGSGLLSHGENRTVTAADGSFEVARVRAGDVALRTESPQHLPGLLELEIAEGERRSGLQIVVDEGRSIAGRVFDDLGRPIEGARVGAQRAENRPGMQVTSFREGESTTTDANGFFVLGGLDGESVYLRAWSQGHGGETRPDVPLGTQNLVFELKRHAVVAGFLRDTSGAPIEGSEVTVMEHRGASLTPMFGGGPTPSAKTAADGSFRIEGVAPGLTSLVAQGDHRAAQLRGFQLRPGEELTGQVLIAAAAAAVDVTVVDPEGNPIAGAEVVVQSPRSPEDGTMVIRSVRAGTDEGTIVEDLSSMGSGTTDSEGRARIGGLEAEVVEVSASHDAYASAPPVTVNLPAAGDLAVRLDMREAGAALVRCVDPAGQPVGGCKVEVTGPEGSQHHDVDAKGAVQIGGLVPGAYDVAITLPPRPLRMGGAVMMIGDQGGRPIDATRISFEVVAGSVTEVTLTKPVLTRVTGRVQEPEGGAAGVVVELEAVDRDPTNAAMAIAGLSSGPSDETDSNGVFEITDVTPGRYTVRWGRPGQIVKDRKEIEVLRGQAVLELDLALRGGTIRVAVRDTDGAPLPNAKVRVVRAGAERETSETNIVMFSTVSVDVSGSAAGPGSTTSMTLGDNSVAADRDGIATIEGVPPGEYRLVVSLTGYADGRIEPVTVVDRGLADAGILQLEAAAMVGGSIVGLAPGPGGIVMARVEYRKEGASDWRSSTSSADRFFLDSLTPGKWVFRASPLGPGSEPGPEVQVELSRGNNPELELRLK